MLAGETWRGIVAFALCAVTLAAADNILRRAAMLVYFLALGDVGAGPGTARCLARKIVCDRYDCRVIFARQLIEHADPGVRIVFGYLRQLFQAVNNISGLLSIEAGRRGHGAVTMRAMATLTTPNEFGLSRGPGGGVSLCQHQQKEEAAN